MKFRYPFFYPTASLPESDEIQISDFYPTAYRSESDAIQISDVTLSPANAGSAVTLSSANAGSAVTPETKKILKQTK